MILRDRVTIQTRASQNDPWETIAEQIPAEVRPLGSADLALGGTETAFTSARYRVLVKPGNVSFTSDDVTLRIFWRDFTEESGHALLIEGAVERHMLGGRVRMYSFRVQTLLSPTS